ncbi:carbon-nitrogen hydrolase family protein [Microbulbifer hainanensis]|uniref:carbon-nitrogen hydrolase family protein n=1 Tax=Microbulbifer hainanensis TaxID=2735675 RepID=UPI001866C0E1|nr:carbon-nitrogen hydrolase family protein [Microbulbifer hainanensis]
MIRKICYLLLALLLFTALLVSVLVQRPLPATAVAATEPEVLLEPLNPPQPNAANLLSIQPYLVAADYASADRLYRKLDGYMARARDAGWLNDRTLVVFPEHIGTWLVAEGESFLAYRAETTSGALLWAALGNLPAFGQHLLGEEAADPFAAAMFKTKAAAMAHDYQRVFATLAGRYGVTLVAGSIALPDPQLQDGEIRAGSGPIYNSSFVFYADGSVAGPVRKMHPIASELPFTEPAAQALPLFDTPLGKLGILICADSWYPDTWRQLRDADLVAVPSFSTPEGIWARSWGGYNGAAAPADVDPADVGQLTEGEAWRKYALGGRGGQLRAGINTFLRGDLWDLGDDGQTTAVLRGTVIQGQRRDGAVITSLWLPTADYD